MTCKDAINSDASSEDKELYFLSENGSYNKSCMRSKKDHKLCLVPEYSFHEFQS